MKITELDLEKMGFDKIVVSPEESGDATGYYYFEYELSEVNNEFCLISVESDKVTDDTWKVQLFQTPDYEFGDRDDLRLFIECISKFKRK
tara:strand:+ start:60 stop:329 length:270 start_codon:yes stop_codon:yes gene_type:complete